MRSTLTAGEIAKALKVHRATVGRWIKRGQIPEAVKVPGKQGFHIPLAVYEKLLAERPKL